MAFHGWDIRLYFRCLQAQHGVDIPQRPALSGQQLYAFRQQHQTAYSLPSCIGIWKMIADIFEICCPKDGITDGVHQDIRVGMPERARIVLHPDPPEHKWLSFPKLVDIKAEPYFYLRHEM